MSFEKLLIIFIIIILPIAFVLNIYVNTQTDTLNMQSLYDVKLSNATNDALNAYKSNAFNESTSDLTQMQMRNVEASSNVFMNSIANNFNMQGFSKDTLESHVPALVFTMYDGFYIYSKFKNDIGNVNIDNTNENVGYKKDELLYGVKPYINYSCRYKRNNDDFVITYSLDNYITIQGTIGGQWINDSGYLIDNINNDTGSTINYRNVTIGSEDRNTIFKEYVGNQSYVYIKKDGIKYYYDSSKPQSEKKSWFNVINGVKKYIYDANQKTPAELGSDNSAYKYYKEAAAFRNRVENIYKLGNLTPQNAVEAYNSTNVNSYDSTDENKKENFYEYNFGTTNPNAKIFLFNSGGVSIEDPDSNFNEHRRAVIRYSIEKNLSIAIANYNTYANVSTNFQMPVLSETEWDKVLNNICLISFMQGLPMGTKYYNGSAVVQNNENEEVVAEDSIYIVQRNNTAGNTTTNTYYYYDVKSKELQTSEVANPVGILNTDLEERKLYNNGFDNNIRVDYYFPKLYYADYGSIVTKSSNVNIFADKTDYEYKYAFNGNIYKYLEYLRDNKGTKRNKYSKSIFNRTWKRKILFI